MLMKRKAAGAFRCSQGAAILESDMKALVYLGPGRKAIEDRPKAEIQSPGDAIVRMLKTSLCGTDLHILKGEVLSCRPGRVLGHEGVGIVAAVGAGVGAFHTGDHVVISSISSCGKCDACRRSLTSHCSSGGWLLGNEIDGTQAEYVRIPHADRSLYRIPPGADDDAMVMLSDVLPTGFECGVLNGKVAPGATVDEETVIKAVKADLAGYKAPKRVVFVAQVPRAPNGKADYRTAKQYASG